MKLEGKVAIVTGAGSGIGRGISLRYAREGARVVVADLNADAATSVAGEIAASNGESTSATVDVRDQDQVRAMVDTAVETFGGVDILVNNAGTSSAGGFENVDDEAWQTDIDLKLMAAVRFCRLVIPIMKRRGGGAILNVTTIGGKAPAPRALPTSVTRAAGINLTKSLAGEYAADGIRVNTICLGLVKSAQWERRAGGDLEAYYRDVARRIPLGRVGEASEFADLVAFLVSERARYITGTAVNFDGGMAAVV
jgi:NAD(P)-dependent dehydrogenase (short-subunit alcohol dehydrogenase family)